MNAPHTPPLLASIEMAPRDPILGVTEAFHADPNPRKVNLGVGVYCDDHGKVPLLECVRQAEQALADKGGPHVYLPIDGIAAYDRAVRNLVFGAESEVVQAGRVVTVQALGGTGSLKVGADFLRRFAPGAQVWISDPSWENHRALFEASGFTVNSYPYYFVPTHGLDFDGMIGALERMPAGAIVVLHACCHNPTGVDPDDQQWDRIIEVVRVADAAAVSRHRLPGIRRRHRRRRRDRTPVRRHGRTVVRGEFLLQVVLAVWRTRGRRIYCRGRSRRSVACAVPDQARGSQQLLEPAQLWRPSRSDDAGRHRNCALLWERELGAMRERIRDNRRALVERLAVRAPGMPFDFVLRQRGMFSYSGLTEEQVARLRDEFSIYAINTGRICVAALNARNIDYVADAIAHVLA